MPKPIFVAMLILAGCASTQRTTYIAPEYSQTETVTFDGIQYQITEILWANEFGKQYLKQKPNATFLIIKLSLTNLTKKPLDKVFSPIFALEDQDSAEYEPSRVALTDGLAMKLMMQPLNPNVTVQGYVVFDVHKYNDYRLRIRSPFYARQSSFGRVKVLGYYFYYLLNPERHLERYEVTLL